MQKNECSPSPLVVVAGVSAVALVGLVDYATGEEVRVFPLYSLPIAYFAWRSSRTRSTAFAGLTAAAWAMAHYLTGGRYSTPFVWPINIVAMFVAFETNALLVSELQSRLRAERDLSRKDDLTGLRNGRSFHEHGTLLLTVARRSGLPVTLAFLDLDNFKAVNDQLGHSQGDRALMALADVLGKHLRAGDLVARLGGDEFAILLPDTDHDAALTLLERIREHVSARMGQNAWPVTLSVGAASYSHPPATLEEAVHDADLVMFRAKATGKNRVVIVRFDDR